MKRGGRILLFVVVVIVILGAVGFFVLGRGGGGLSSLISGTPTPPPPQAATIVTVGQPINRDSPITLESLSSMEIPADHITEKMIRDPQTVVGKYAIFPLAQGLPLTVDMISDRPGMNQPGSPAARVISPGLVAISIPLVSGRGLDFVAYGVQDGDHVNVIATTLFVDIDPTFQTSLPNLTAKVTGSGTIPDTLPVLTAEIGAGGAAQGRGELDPTLNQAFYVVPSEGKQRPRLVSQMILQNVQVLHVGEFSLDGQPTPVPATPAPPPKPNSITLIMAPQDAVALTYLLNSGAQFTLTLRAPDDNSRVDTEAATLQYLLSQYAIPVPAKLPYGMEPSTPVLSRP